MAINIYPKIVTDGLELVLDAANSKSYPGTGTTWTDIISNKTFIPDNNTPIFNTTGIAYVDFEASSNPGDNLKSTSGYTGMAAQNAYTRIAWFNHESNSSFRPIIGNQVGNNIDMGLCVYNSLLHFRQYTRSQSSGTTSGDYGVYGTTSFSTGTWNQGVIVVNRAAQNLKIYLNGSLDLDTSINLIGTSGSNTVMIGGPDADSYSGARMYDGKTSIVMHYNRALTATEVAQNFQAFRGRFGV